MGIQNVKVIVNGQEYTLAYNGTSGKYEANITAPGKSSNRMKRDSNLTGTVNGSDIHINLTANSDQDINFTTVYKNGIPVDDVNISYVDANTIRVLNESETSGWTVEYRLVSPIDGGTGGNYNVYIEVTDEAGNITRRSLQADTELVVKETTAPTISGLSPSSGAKVNTATPVISGNFSDSDSGIDTNSFELNIDSGAIVVTKGSPGLTLTTSSFSYTPQSALSEGSHSYTVTIADNDGNSKTSSSQTFTVDTIAPALNITNPTDGLITNNASLTVSGTTESTATITIKLNGSDQGAVTVNGDGTFSKVITLASGSNTIEIKSTDTAGNTTTVTRNITLDTVAPTISMVEIIPNPVDGGATFIIKVTASD